MGVSTVSTDAIVCFGFEIGDEDELPEFLIGYENGWEDFLKEESGLPKYGEDGHSWDADYDYEKAHPAILVIHCSSQHPMYIIAVNHSVMTAKRGYALPIDGTLQVNAKKLADFLKWCKKYNLDGDPQWHLCSMWG